MNLALHFIFLINKYRLYLQITILASQMISKSWVNFENKIRMLDSQYTDIYCSKHWFTFRTNRFKIVW